MDSQTVRKRLAMLEEDLTAAEVDRSALWERLKEAHESMRGRRCSTRPSGGKPKTHSRRCASRRA